MTEATERYKNPNNIEKVYIWGQNKGNFFDQT